MNCSSISFTWQLTCVNGSDKHILLSNVNSNRSYLTMDKLLEPNSFCWTSVTCHKYCESGSRGCLAGCRRAPSFSRACDVGISAREPSSRSPKPKQIPYTLPFEPTLHAAYSVQTNCGVFMWKGGQSKQPTEASPGRRLNKQEKFRSERRSPQKRPETDTF